MKNFNYHPAFMTVLIGLMVSMPILASGPRFAYGETGFEIQGNPIIQSAAKELSTITAFPAPGIVRDLSEVKVAFIGVTSLEIQSGNEDYFPRIESSDGTEYQGSEMKIEGNALIVKFNPIITAEDTYTFIIPKEYIKVDGTFLGSDVTFIYYISSSGDSGIIYDQPAGEKVTCQSDFLSYFVLEGGLSGMPLAGKPLHYVLGEDGNLYLYNIITLQPYGGTQTSSYIVGTPSGENKWKFSFPQPIYETYANGENQIWYLNYLYTYIDQTSGSGTYKIYEQNNSVEFMIVENGNATWVRDIEDPSVDDGYAIGATRPDGTWTGFANVVRSTYQKFTDVAPEINPETFEIWEMTTGPNGNRTKRNVDVYFEGNDVWIRGFSKTYLPDAWAHGVINGKTITFDPYIGECDFIGQYLFLYGYSNGNRTNLQFKYYPAEKGMTYNGEYIINPNQLFYYATESYEYPSLEYLCEGSGVEQVSEDEVESVEWFDLSGLPKTEPTKGLNICRKVLKSGIVKYSKTVIL